MILQFYLAFLWSEKPMSPGREEPTAGADVFAAQRGSVVCSWARLSVCTGNITSSIFWFVNPVKSNQFFVWNINTFDGLNHHSDRSKPLCFGGRLRNFDGFVSDWPRWPLGSESEKFFRLTRTWSAWRPIWSFNVWRCQQKRNTLR